MKNFLFLFTTLIIICFFSNLKGQEKSNTNLIKNIDQYIERIIVQWKVPGLAIGVVKDTNILIAKGYGYRDIENNLQVDENTLFNIASCTKAFTAVSIGCLIDQKTIKLDDPIIKLVPTLKFYEDYVSKNITYRDMLSHRSGVPSNNYIYYRTDRTRKEIFNILQYLPPSKGFREAYQYNNLTYISLGHIIEKITDITWEEFVTENILNPLQMYSTTISYNDFLNSSNNALPYYANKGEPERIPIFNHDESSPCGGINSNAKEMCNWLIMNLNNGNFNQSQIVSSNFLQQTHSTQIGIIDYTPRNEFFISGYGLGWMIGNYRGKYSARHSGSNAGYSSFISIFPTESIGIIILINNNNRVDLARAICDEIADELLKKNKINWVEKEYEKKEIRERNLKEKHAKSKGLKPSMKFRDYSDYVGEYEHPAYGTFNVYRSNKDLMATLKPYKFNLGHIKYDIFEIEIVPDVYNPLSKHMDNTKVQFYSNIDGIIEKIVVNFPDNGNIPIVFKKVDE